MKVLVCVADAALITVVGWTACHRAPSVDAAPRPSAAPAASQAAPSRPTATPSPHVDPKGLEQSVLDATLAFLRDDAASARAALDRVEAGCRRLGDGEDAPEIVPDLVTYDRAFHVALTVSRELAGRGDLTKSFDQFVWVQRGCRTCHGIARDPAQRGSRPHAQEILPPPASSVP